MGKDTTVNHPCWNSEGCPEELGFMSATRPMFSEDVIDTVLPAVEHCFVRPCRRYRLRCAPIASAHRHQCRPSCQSAMHCPLAVHLWVTLSLLVLGRTGGCDQGGVYRSASLE